MIIVIFGASGDLAKRKLFPSLSTINYQDIKIIGYSRANIASKFKDKLMEYHNYDKAFLNKIQYISGQYDDLSALHQYKNDKILFYFSLPPKVYKTLLKSLVIFTNARIAVEKPFGDSLDDFIELQNFNYQNSSFKVYWIDHYLLKPMCVALPYLKNDNEDLQKILDKKYIHCIEVVSNEELGIEGRAYFDDYGIVKDILQNHLVSFFCTVFGEYKNFNSQEDIENARCSLINGLYIDYDKCLYGQYKRYICELGRDSRTETYAFIPIKSTTPKLKNIPIFIYGGKGLDEKRTEIIVTFKSDYYKQIIEDLLKGREGREELIMKKNIDSVALVFNIAPKNGVCLHIRVNGELFKYSIFSSRRIMQKMCSMFGKQEDHGLVFEAFISDKEFPVTSIEEGRMQWEIFQWCHEKRDKRPFPYDKGTRVPREAATILKEVKDNND